MTATSGSLLLVDGYNIIGAWSSLKKIRDRDGLEAARQELPKHACSSRTLHAFSIGLLYSLCSNSRYIHRKNLRLF
jgi:uncharacterized protein